jgi:hypothetical protein
MDRINGVAYEIEALVTEIQQLQEQGKQGQRHEEHLREIMHQYI